LPSFRHRRALTLAALVGAAVVVGLSASPGSARQAKFTPGPWCGGQLWRQITFSDVDRKKVDTTPMDASIQGISQLSAPAKIGLRRSTPFQLHTWHLSVIVDRYRIGTDGEIALVLYSIPTAQYMNAYLPNPACLSPKSRERAQMIAARKMLTSHCAQVTPNWQLLGIWAMISGVGFWNPLNTTRGALPNGAELRPITGFQIVSGCGFPMSSGP
jgi:hypothetical protein